MPRVWGWRPNNDKGQKTKDAQGPLLGSGWACYESDMHNYRKLRIWSDGKDLVARVYRETESFPRAERYRLADQMRRAAVSIPSNIAEGSSRRSNKEFARFLRIALGSAYELDTQLDLSAELGYMDHDCAIALQEDLEFVRARIARLETALAT